VRRRLKKLRRRYGNVRGYTGSFSGPKRERIRG
jgi:hypothetical protein